MKIVRPYTVVDATLTACNVVETPPAAYAGGTTYGLGATVTVGTVGALLTVYTSLQAANTGHAPASSPTWWKATGTVYAEYSAGATYALGDIVQITATHKVYESLQAANTGKAPATETTWWVDRGATNRWKMFDQSVTSQTTNPDSIVFTLAVTGRVDTLALLNISAATVQVTMIDAVDGTIYDQTFTMTDNMGVTDWYAYFFEPIERSYDCVVTDLPVYSNAPITITLTDTGNNAACGACIVGQSRDVGSTQFGVSVGIQDYSQKDRDTWGNPIIVERSYAKRGNFTLEVNNGLVDRLHALLASYRATPILYIGVDIRSSTAIYGFYKDFTIEIAYLTHSICTIEIEGLT